MAGLWFEQFNAGQAFDQEIRRTATVAKRDEDGAYAPHCQWAGGLSLDGLMIDKPQLTQARRALGLQH